jgi:2-keto-3-deoxy-L-fuconate dehydrogenase
MSHLHGKRILLTQSNDCMGPALCKELATHGADVIADARFPIEPHDPEEILQDTSLF